ncbi:MAG TPA: PQ-loop repeat-containing protein, partial [Ktedonobacterales bacterium]|nr:PQ-loop repeat-containing protein [Ktedonobacterales bacterium]
KAVIEPQREMHKGDAAMDINLPVIAGMISTIIFALSIMPMLLKAFQTKNLGSYSLGNILLANLGNVIHSVYVFHLPPGPIWALHTFYLVTTGMMLVWYLRYEWLPRHLAAALRARLARGRVMAPSARRSEAA